LKDVIHSPLFGADLVEVSRQVLSNIVVDDPENVSQLQEGLGVPPW